jgi:hypothetical protein
MLLVRSVRHFSARQAAASEGSIRIRTLEDGAGILNSTAPSDLFAIENKVANSSGIVVQIIRSEIYYGNNAGSIGFARHQAQLRWQTLRGAHETDAIHQTSHLAFRLRRQQGNSFLRSHAPMRRVRKIRLAMPECQYMLPKSAMNERHAYGRSGAPLVWYRHGQQ